jgi:hypothetical protein
VTDRSETYESLTPQEKKLLSKAIRTRAAARTEEQRRVVRKYWAGMRQRSRAGLSRISDLRTNQDYRAWLASKGRPTEPFNDKWWNEWLGEGRP